MEKERKFGTSGLRDWSISPGFTVMIMFIARREVAEKRLVIDNWTAFLICHRNRKMKTEETIPQILFKTGLCCLLSWIELQSSDFQGKQTNTARHPLRRTSHAINKELVLNPERAKTTNSDTIG